MRDNDRKYTFMLVMSLLTIALLTVVGIREPFRMQAAARAQTDKMIIQGAKIFAANCVVCHGPAGEGHIGMALNRPELRGDPEKMKSVYDELIRTVSRGRPGTGDPLWKVVNNRGEMMSYSAMPAWSRSENGPLDDSMVQAVVYFLMLGDYSAVGEHIPGITWAGEPGDADEVKKEKTVKALPAYKGTELNAQQVTQAQRIFVDKGCVTCHTAGAVGGKIGPDLSKISTWGVDATFLRDWIADPAKKPNRMPVYWSKHRAIGPEPQLKDPVNYPATVMPAMFKLPDDAAQLDLLVKYLMGLK